MNLTESMKLSDGFKFVWEFTPSQGNGTIAAVGLTSKHGGANAYGSEVLLTPVESGATISLGKSVKMKVTGAPATAGSMAIPAGSYVLSGHGTSKTFVDGLTVGEELEVSMSATTAEGKAYNPVWSVGGCPVLLKGGVVQETENANIIDHLPTNQPIQCRSEKQYSAPAARSPPPPRWD